MAGGLGDRLKTLATKMSPLGAKGGFPPRGGNPFSSRLKPAENGSRFTNGSRFWTSLDKFGQVWTSLDVFFVKKSFNFNMKISILSFVSNLNE